VVRVIRHAKSGEYFTKGKWTPDFNQAQTFEGVTEVIAVCSTLKLKDVEMVLRIDPERPDIQVPIPDD
jgi:hypothetical protein